MIREQKVMSLAARVILGFASICLMLAIVVGVSLWQVHTLNNTITTLVDVRVPTIETTLRLALSINKSSIALRNWLITHRDNYRQDRELLWQGEIASSLDKLDQLSQYWTNQKSKIALNAFETNIDKLKNEQNKIQKAEETKKMSGYILLDEEGNNIMNSVSDSANQLITIESSLLQDISRNTVNNVTVLTATEWSMFSLAMLLSGIVALLISRSIAKPVRDIENAMTSLADGSLAKEINVNGPREIQQLSQTINHMIKTMSDITDVVKSVSEGNYDTELHKRSDQDMLIASIINMTDKLRANKTYYDEKTWLQTGVNSLVSKITNNQELSTLMNEALSDVCEHIKAGVGALYIFDDKTAELVLKSSYAFVERDALASSFVLGNGIVGQVAIEKKPILLKNIVRNDMVISTAITEGPPINTYTFPLLDKRELIGVITLGFNESINNLVIEYINQISPILSSSINIALQKLLADRLLKEQRALSEELQTQQEELKSANEELETQAEELKTSEEELRARDEEQRSLNNELEDRNKILEQQKTEMELAKQNLVKKAEELQSANKYKTEFLSNMSHEFRTPLNSLLLLTKMLAENKENNLTSEQIQSLQIVHSSGNELLHLINDILDLSKVEAGKMTIEVDDLNLNEFISGIEKDFKHVAEEKNIKLLTEIDPKVKNDIIKTDINRVKQIVKNLISNAIKFTENGSVKILISPPNNDINYDKIINKNSAGIAISIADTGIGIPVKQQSMVFQNFYQCDGSSKRQYGGTGLGLSISLQLAKLLNGEIHFSSEENKGSTFTLFLPLVLSKAVNKNEIEKIVDTTNDLPIKSMIMDVVNAHDTKENKLLIVEDDLQFSKILMDVCTKKGFECVHSGSGMDAVRLAKAHKPVGILMDVNLPDTTGIVVADMLKKEAETKSIPIHFISGDDRSEEAKKAGAVGFLMKPITTEQLDAAIKDIAGIISNKVSSVLVVEDDSTLLDNICHLLKDKANKIIGVKTAKEVLDVLKVQDFDCIILDLGLPDISGFELLKIINDSSEYNHPPVIVYTGRQLTEDEHNLLQRYTNNIIIKNNASMRRLQDETSLFLHSLSKDSIKYTPSKSEISFDPKKQFKGKKILLVDDDMRNTFSLAKLLNSYDIEVLIAPHGKSALEILSKEPDVHAVLMDLMMPVMDGFETIEKIREQKRFSRLPIIALTAKTMASDKEKCMTCGATDYLTKPLDIDKLLVSLRAWL